MIDLVRQEAVKSASTIVVKVGTNVLTRPDGALDEPHLARLAEQIARVHEQGRRVVLVSSGAIGAGLARLGRKGRPTELPQLQAAAAIGQSDLMNAYDRSFRPHGIHPAQILLTASDFDDRARYLNVRNTILELFQWNAIPIINENDTVSVDEIRFGDNDRLAAMVTNLIRAPLLVILSVVDGLYASPDAQGEPIDIVMALDDATLALAGTSTSTLGTGGMQSKLQAARMATFAGESVWIANGKSPDILMRILAGERVGTFFPARGESLASWKRWIGYTVRPRGSYIVDPGAKAALIERGKSLLPVGVIGVDGTFAKGDVVAIECPKGVPFARGLTNYASQDALHVMGQSKARLAELFPGSRYDEVIHRDNLVVL